MTKEEIGQILKELRLSCGKTQKEVAELLGRKQQIVGHWETGYSQPDANTLFILCDIYGTTVDAAFGFKKSNTTISKKDLEFLKKYHALDERGRKMVDSALEEAYNTRPIIPEGQTSLLPIDGYWCIGHNGKWERIEKADFVGFETNAAHPDETATTEEREADDNMMKDDSEWK